MTLLIGIQWRSVVRSTSLVDAELLNIGEIKVFVALNNK